MIDITFFKDWNYDIYSVNICKKFGYVVWVSISAFKKLPLVMSFPKMSLPNFLLNKMETLHSSLFAIQQGREKSRGAWKDGNSNHKKLKGIPRLEKPRALQ